MEVAYIYTIFVFVFCAGLLLGCWWYIQLRMRWHEKGIVDFRYDGWEDRNNPNAKTFFDCWREEKEYDRKMKETKND